MPAAGLAGLLSSGTSVAEGLLVERLEWVKGWAEAVHNGDADPQCRDLASACRSLQVGCLGFELLLRWFLGKIDSLFFPPLYGHSAPSTMKGCPLHEDGAVDRIN